MKATTKLFLFVITTLLSFALTLLMMSRAHADEQHPSARAWALMGVWYDPVQAEPVTGKPRIISSKDRCDHAADEARETMWRKGIAATTACAEVVVPLEYLVALRKFEDENQIPLLQEEKPAKPADGGEL